MSTPRRFNNKPILEQIRELHKYLHKLDSDINTLSLSITPNTQDNTPISEVDNGDGTFTYSRTSESGIADPSWTIDTNAGANLWSDVGNTTYRAENVTINGISNAFTTSNLNIVGNEGLRFMSTDNITTRGRIVPNLSGEFLFEGGNNNPFVFQSLGNNEIEGFVFRNKIGTDVGIITQSGKLGMGTLVPTEDLHIINNAVIQGVIYLNSAKTVGIFTGTGSPETVVTASPGSTFHNTSGGAGTSFYVKESGIGTATGWIAK